MKKILVFSGQDQIGDAIIKLPFLYCLRKQFPKDHIVWMTNLGSVYKKELHVFVKDFINEVWDNAELSFLPWKKISKKYNLEIEDYDLVIDTQKSIKKSLILKRIKNKCFLSSSASFLLSSKKPKSIRKKNQYYLNDLIELLSLYKGNEVVNDYTLEIPLEIKCRLNEFFSPKKKYFGIAPGAGQDNKIWNIKNYIKVAQHFQNQDYTIVAFLGPLEKEMKKILESNISNIVFPEYLLSEFNGPQVVMASTSFLKCVVSNDSGTSHMLSTNLCPLIKLFGPKSAIKFTPNHLKNIFNIKATDFGDDSIDNIPVNYVIERSSQLIDNN